MKRIKPIPEYKTEAVKELVNNLKKNQTFLIASVKNLPGGQYQAIKYKLRDVAKIKVLKKSIILRALDKFDKGIEKIRDYVKEDCAFLFSNQDPFELSATLSDNLSPSKAKVGQEVPEDIKIDAGPTELTPGPIISELGALGIPIQIEDGKITIKTEKIILKAGDPVNDAAASIMAKLDIKPFKVGFEPLAAYDTKESKFYANVKIDKEGTLEALKESYSKTLALSVSIAYSTKDNIGYLLSKALTHYTALEKLSPKEEVKEEKPTEEKSEEKKEEEKPAESEEKKEKVKKEDDTQKNKSDKEEK